MSSFRKVTITCPDCNTEGKYTIWDSVNVDLDPKLKEKVMDGSIFDWECPHCKKHFTVPYQFLYHDMTHNFMVYYDPDTALIPFCEYLRIKENNLDDKAIHLLAEKYRQDHLRENILFDSITDDNQLLFSVWTMPDKYWQPTDRKYTIPFADYESVL